MSQFEHSMTRSTARRGQKSLFAILAGSLAFAAVTQAQYLPYTNTTGDSRYQLTAKQKKEADAVVEQIIANMSNSEKVGYLGATVFAGFPRFGVPTLSTTEGMMGEEGSAIPGIVYPSGPSLAATWNPAMAAQRGRQVGLDGQAGGFQLVNGPGLNFYRLPFGGRAAEYMSGEDPILGAVLGTSFVEGEQSTGVMAELKHSFAYEQESNRGTLNTVVDERTLHELYEVPFESAVKLAKPAAIMCAFSTINGTRSCQDQARETGLIKQTWGFDGFIQSDYDVIQDGVAAANAGTDFDSPNGAHMSPAVLLAALQAGTVTQARIDDKVRRILRQITYFKMGPNVAQPANSTEPDRAEGEDIALKAEQQGIVLLENQNSNLPLSKSIRSIAVLGAFVDTEPARSAGSGFGTLRHYTSELAGVKAAAGSGVKVDLIQENVLDPANTSTVNGWTGYYFGQTNFQGTPTLIQQDAVINTNWLLTGEPGCGGVNCGSTVWVGKIKPTITGDYVFKVRADGEAQVVVDGNKILANNTTPTSGSNGLNLPVSAYAKMFLNAGQTYDVTVTYSADGYWVPYLGGLFGMQFSYAALVPAARVANYDAVIVSGGLGSEYEGEGIDHDFNLPEYQSELIANTASLNAHTTAVLYTSSAIDMSAFNKKVASLVYAWYPGQNGGTALADVLFGNVTPSGKLPITLDAKIAENPATSTFPLPINYSSATTLNYSEGLYVGYRGYDKAGTAPLYPFGYGLSYTTFRYSDLTLTSSILNGQTVIDVNFNVTNTGNVRGAEVAQVYVGEKNPLVDRPLRELKGFQREVLAPGATKVYTVHLNPRAFAYYDTKSDSWVVDAAKFEISVGASSRDIRLTKVYRNAVGFTLSTASSTPAVVPNHKQ